MPDKKKLTYKRCRKLLEGFLARLRQSLGEDLLAAALYGSVARDQGGRTSDLDILILHREASDTALNHFVQASQELRQSREYRKLTEQGFLPDPCPVFFSLDQLKMHPWLLLDVLDHGIILYDRESLLREELDKLKEKLELMAARKIYLPDGTWYWDLKPDWKPGEVIEL